MTSKSSFRQADVARALRAASKIPGRWSVMIDPNGVGTARNKSPCGRKNYFRGARRHSQVTYEFAVCHRGRAGMPRKTTESLCALCGSSTKHDIIGSDRQEGTNEDSQEAWSELHEMVKCRGCGSVSMRHSHQTSSEDRPTVDYIPHLRTRFSLTPAWTLGLESDFNAPQGTCDLMAESYMANEEGLYRLAAMGIRAALESVMIDKVGDHGKWISNIDAFEKAGYLSVRERSTLDTIIKAGDAAIHRGWEPDSDNVSTLLTISTAIIAKIYFHEPRAETLERKVPKRPPRVQKT